MHPLEHIRKNVLELNQTEMAAVAGVSQGTVSRWEDGKAEPNRDELNRIRGEIKRRKLEWDDAWFFKIPKNREHTATVAAGGR